jgi:hypothetical protein
MLVVLLPLIDQTAPESLPMLDIVWHTNYSQYSEPTESRSPKRNCTFNRSK